MSLGERGDVSPPGDNCSGWPGLDRREAPVTVGVDSPGLRDYTPAPATSTTESIAISLKSREISPRRGLFWWKQTFPLPQQA